RWAGCRTGHADAWLAPARRPVRSRAWTLRRRTAQTWRPSSHGAGGAPSTPSRGRSSSVRGGGRHLRWEAARRDGTPVIDRHPDEALALADHRGAVLVPVVVLAGDAPEVLDQRLHRLG